MADKTYQKFVQECGKIKERCHACGQEKAYCNTYMTADNRTITICPECLAFGTSEICNIARQADKESRRVPDEKDDLLNSMRKKKKVVKNGQKM